MKSSLTAVAKPSTTSPLLRLPAELRNVIYDHIAHSTEEVAFVKGRVAVMPSPTLASVCGQVHSEFLPILDAYVQCHADALHADIVDVGFDELWAFLKGLGLLANGTKRIVTVRATFTKPGRAMFDSFRAWEDFSKSDQARQAYTILCMSTYKGSEYDYRSASELPGLPTPHFAFALYIAGKRLIMEEYEEAGRARDKRQQLARRQSGSASVMRRGRVN
ncbi:hypothetical protein LTR85_001354 [Meristemomyces frigidus]|nr:hypothetical protein LTR85_001354 [Meristemomyces frigidus]